MVTGAIGRWGHVRGARRQRRDARQAADEQVGERVAGEDQARARLLPLGQADDLVGALGGVRADDVVHDEPWLAARVDAGGLQQAGLDQLLDRGLARRPVEQQGEAPGGVVGDVDHADEAEEVAGGLGQRRVAQREAGADLQVADGQLVEAAALVGEPVGQLPQPQLRAQRQPGGGDPQRQRQVPARGGDPRGTARVPADAHAGHAFEQLLGLGVGERRDAHPVRAGQAGQPAAAGDEDGAGRRAG